MVPGVWLLDLVVGGRVFRYSTSAIEVLDSRGRAYLYREGLTDLEVELDGFNETQGFEILDQRVSWARLAAAEPLSLATATLRHILPGQALEQALVVLEGAVDEPEYGDPENPRALVGTIQVDEADRLWPDPRAAVNASTWELNPSPTTGVDRTILGVLYPTIFGYPGDDSEGASDAEATTPALLVFHTTGVFDSAVFVIADGEVDATEVRLYGTDQMVFGNIGGTDVDFGRSDYTVVPSTDLLGRKVATIEVPFTRDLAPLTTVEPNLGEEFWVGWSSGVGKGGGNLLPDRSGPIRSVVDVAIWALTRSGRKADLQAQEAERDRLGSYNVDGYLCEELATVPWFESTIAKVFPLTRARTPRGMYWRYLDYAAGPIDAVYHVNADAGRAWRAGSVRTPVDPVKNRFTLDFQYYTPSGQYGNRRVLASEAEAVQPWYQQADLSSDDRVVGSPLLALSESIFGLREAAGVGTKFVWDASTALQILTYWSRRDAFPRRLVRYRADAGELRRLTRGDIVVVSDAEVAFDLDVAMVVSVHLSSSQLAAVDLEVLDRRVRG
jgi:hypothetical protein